jgi:hypothetical protein
MLATSTRGYSRVIAYSGAPSSALPHRDDVLRWRLGEIGKVVQMRSFATGPLGTAQIGWLYVFDLTGAPATGDSPAPTDPAGANTTKPPPLPALPVLRRIAYSCLSLSP